MRVRAHLVRDAPPAPDARPLTGSAGRRSVFPHLISGPFRTGLHEAFAFSIGAAPQACLSIGDAGYRTTTNNLGADLTVRIDPAAAAPDMRIHIAETAAEADFVFVDDGNAPPTCQHGARTIKSVKIGAAGTTPDLVVGFATTVPADYRIYVRSRWLSPEATAALFAAAHVPGTSSRAARRIGQSEPIALAPRQP